jgi:small multidrug resistance pump
MKTLKLAAIYNLLWGALVILFPHLFFDLAGMERTNYPEIWQCVGMIVGVYGVGYWMAAQDPVKHYPVVLVGFLGKILGPIGFAQALITGRFPLAFGIIIIFNDLIWWIPFYKLLKEKYQRDKTFLT